MTIASKLSVFNDGLAELAVDALTRGVTRLLVSVWVSVVPTTTPDGITFCAAEPSMLPEAFESTKLEAAMPESVLLSALIVLLVRVCVSVVPTIVPEGAVNDVVHAVPVDTATPAPGYVIGSEFVIVTAVDPLYDVPVNPDPIVKALATDPAEPVVF
jgi:hypothetical protein